MASLKKSVGTYFKSRGVVLPVYVAAWLLFVCSLYLSLQDYTTSYHGAKLLPFALPYAFGYYIVAALPQLVQIVFGASYFALDHDDTRRAMDNNPQLIKWIRFAFLVAAAFFVVDVYTGMAHYLSTVALVPDAVGDVVFFSTHFWEHNLKPALWTLLWTVVIDSIGSEVFLIVSVGLIIELREDAVEAWRKFKSAKGVRSKPKGRSSNNTSGQGQQSRRSRRGGGQNSSIAPIASPSSQSSWEEALRNTGERQQSEQGETPSRHRR